MTNCIGILSTILHQIKIHQNSSEFIFRNRDNLMIISNSHPAPCSTSRFERIGRQALSQILTTNNGNLLNSFGFQETEMTTNSHPVPCWSKSKKNYKTSRLDPIGHQALSRTLMANYRNLFNLFRFSDPLVDLTEPTAISKTCQRHPKTPRGTPEHGTSAALCRRPWNFDVSSRVLEVAFDKKPTCGVWRQNLVSRFQLKLYWTGQIGKIKLYNGPRCIPKSSATIAKDNNTCSIRFILWLIR